MATVCVGIDIGSSKSAICALDKLTGETKYEREVATEAEAIVRALKSIEGELEVHFESGELARWMYKLLKPHAKEVCVSHPKSNAYIARDPLKDDPLDARKLALLKRAGLVHAIYMSDDDDIYEFKRLVQHYERLTQGEVRQKNQIKARLRGYGIITRGREVFAASARSEWLSKVPSDLGRISLEQSFAVLDAALAGQKQALKALRTASKRFPPIRRFQTMPGIGLILACVFFAYIQDPERFKTRQRLWRYCRLGIARQMSSGKPLGPECLDRNGCPALKNLSRQAFLGAMSTKKMNAFKTAYAESLERTHHKDHARLNVQRRILLVLWKMWLNGRDYKEKNDDLKG